MTAVSMSRIPLETLALASQNFGEVLVSNGTHTTSPRS